MHRKLKEVRTILDDLEANLERMRVIWNPIDPERPLETNESDEWRKKKARCWLHGATDLFETNALEKWIFDYPPPSDFSQDLATKYVDYWRQWLELEDAYYEPFDDFQFGRPHENETLLQFLVRFAQSMEGEEEREEDEEDDKEVEEDEEEGTLWWRAFKSFLFYLRKMPQEQMAFVEQIFPKKMGFSGKHIIRKVAPEVYPIPQETACDILVSLSEQCRFGHPNAQFVAAESLGLCWMCLTASRLR